MIINNTFIQDFRIADHFGEKAIKDTYHRAFNEWKDNYEYLTALVYSLNMLCWYHYEQGNQRLSELYSKYFYEAQEYGYTHLKGEELTYFIRELD